MCSTCGTRAEEWDPRLGGDLDAYVTTRIRCHGCEALDEARTDIPDGPDGYGVKLSLTPYETYAAQQEAREQAARTRNKN